MSANGSANNENWNILLTVSRSDEIGGSSLPHLPYTDLRAKIRERWLAGLLRVLDDRGQSGLPCRRREKGHCGSRRGSTAVIKIRAIASKAAWLITLRIMDS
jgi:hypothetical protein